VALRTATIRELWPDPARGTFVDEPTSTAPRLFLATRSAIAPIHSLIDAALSAGTRASLT
jgi:ferredoxin-NADP reductase